MAIQKFRLRLVSASKLTVNTQFIAPYNTAYPGTSINSNNNAYDTNGAIGVGNSNGTAFLHVRANGTVYQVVLSNASGTVTSGTAVSY